MDLERGPEKTEVFHISMEPYLKKTKKTTLCHINKEMIRYKVHFFLLTGGLGILDPFLPAFVQNQLRVSATAFGTVILIANFVQILSRPFLGFVVDYFNRLKAVISILVVCQILTFFAFFSLPEIPSKYSQNFTIKESNIDFYDPDSCGICNVGNVSKIETNDKISFNSSDKNYMCQYSISCKPHLNHQVYHFCYFHSDLFNKSSSELKEHKPPMIHGKNISSFNNSNSGSCICPNETNRCSLYISNSNLCCNNNSFSCISSNEVLELCSTETEKYYSTNFNSYQFWFFLLLIVSMHICVSGIFVLSDTACCEGVQKNGADYGKQRMFGPIGWGLMSIAGGLLCDYTQSYLAACSVLSVMWIFMLFNTVKMDFGKPNFSITFFKDVGKNFLSTEFIAFEIGVLINGIGVGALWYYLVWFLLSIGGNNLLFGLVHSTQNLLGELPFMFFSGWMLKKIGHFQITTLSLLCFCVRFLYLSYLHNPWYVLFVEWLHGICYGAYYVNIASFAKKKAKPGTEATMQSILFTTYDGLGTAIGNVLTGIGIDYFGAHQTFYFLGIFFGCFSVICFIFTLLNKDSRMVYELKSKTIVTDKRTILNKKNTLTK